MRIHVVCGAGASSTFVAQRLRSAALRDGRDLTVTACTPRSIVGGIERGDLVLVGPHLDAMLETIRDAAAAADADLVLLPSDVFDDRDGSRTLALADDAVARRPRHSERTPR